MQGVKANIGADIENVPPFLGNKFFYLFINFIKKDFLKKLDFRCAQIEIDPLALEI